MVNKNIVRVVYFDGDCSLCHRSIWFVWNNSKRGDFYFASLSDNPELVEKFGDTIVLYEKEIYFSKFQAIRRILKFCHFPYNLLSLLMMIVPVFLGNFLYDFIAKRRKKIFSQQVCVLDLKNKEIKNYLL